MKQFEIEINGERKKVKAQKINGSLWLHCDGRVIERPLRQQTKRRGLSSAGSDEPGKISAPMPGKVIEVLVAAGESVSAGTTVVVMEAMKMEYSLKADLDGIVENVSCIAGDQVSMGQILVRIVDNG